MFMLCSFVFGLVVTANTIEDLSATRTQLWKCCPCLKIIHIVRLHELYQHVQAQNMKNERDSI